MGAMAISRRTFLTLTAVTAGALVLPLGVAEAGSKLPPWLDCFLPDSGFDSACYGKEPEAIALILGDCGEVIHGVKELKVPLFGVEVPQVECSDLYLRDAAGMMLQMAAEDTSAHAFFGGGYRIIEGYGRQRLRVANPWHVGRFCTFNNGKRGLILTNPAAVTFA